VVFIEACAPSPSFWLVTLFVSIATLFPFFTYSALQRRFFPMCHQMIQLMSFHGHVEDPEYCEMVRQRSSSPTLVGCTARFEAKSMSFEGEPWGTNFYLETLFLLCFDLKFVEQFKERKEANGREETQLASQSFCNFFASANPSWPHLIWGLKQTGSIILGLSSLGKYRHKCEDKFVWLCLLNAWIMVL